MGQVQSKSLDLILHFRSQFLITLFVLLNLPLFSSSMQSNAFTFYAIIGVNVLLGLFAIATRKRVHFPSEGIPFRRILPLIIQGTVQSSVFIYIILMTRSSETQSLVLSRIPLIFYQLIFAFIFDYLFIISRGKVYFPEFYVIPMVMSINLFLWFSDNYFIFHLVLIVLGILIKTYVVRNEGNGKSSNIFNPSFIALTLCAFFVIMFNLHTHIYDIEIATIYDRTPGFDIFVLCAGCFTLWLPNSYVESIGAYCAIMFVDYLSETFFGYRLLYRLAGGSVMVAIMLGITDPKTSPHSKPGKFFFGAAFGCSVILINFMMYLFNTAVHDYYSKILSIPILNIFTKKFDEWFGSLFQFELNYYASRIVAILIFGTIFFFTYPRLEKETQPTLIHVLADQVRTEAGFSPVIAKH
ncbi:MAG: RnfABCDGE type electron transport complex subunit D [Gammaproteobacteria bacterium]|nr:RnfABCDGE type electron transport complex subunit D [Gammaproteobacteria bacterium]